MAINHVRGAVKAWGAALPSRTAPAFHRAVIGHIPGELRPALLPLLRQTEHLTGEIRQAEKEIAAMCERYPETGALRQIVGVGPITSLTFVLTIEDPNRLPKNREVGPYLGWCPGAAIPVTGSPSCGSPRKGRLRGQVTISCASILFSTPRHQQRPRSSCTRRCRGS